MQLPKRKDVPVELTWDLSAIYNSEDAMQADLEKVRKLADEIERTYKGRLTTAEAILACLDKYGEWMKTLDLMRSWCNLAASVDYGDGALQERDAATARAAAAMGSRLSFIDSEIIAQDEALSALRPALGAPYQIYNMAKLADMKFPSFRAAGEEHPLGYSLYEDHYSHEGDTEVRRAAFDAFSAKLREYENVTAAAYQACVQEEKIMADQRGYQSVFDYLLFGQKVSRELYDRQIDLIMEKLAPHMRRYAKLLQKVHGLDKMTYADLKLPVDPGYVPPVSVEESKKYIVEGLSVMGADYQEMVRTAYRERWVDFAQNQGKSTGGFCASPYGSHSFILLTWHGQMSDVFTLAHELGHAGHFKACNSAQSVFGTGVSSYFVEAPSTMNELLLGHYLLKTNPDKRFRRWVLSNIVGNTYYHNFVTHLLEAAYQREVYKIVDAGGGVQAERLNQLMGETLKKFWGGAVELTEGAELTWMRQPHYYMGLYSYTYSAGLTVATQACKRIEAEGAPAVEDWKKVLAAGGTRTPLELARMAGVDISTDAPLLDTIETIGGYIDEICRLTEELA